MLSCYTRSPSHRMVKGCGVFLWSNVSWTFCDEKSECCPLYQRWPPALPHDESGIVFTTLYKGSARTLAGSRLVLYSCPGTFPNRLFQVSFQGARQGARKQHPSSWELQALQDYRGCGVSWYLTAKSSTGKHCAAAAGWDAPAMRPVCHPLFSVRVSLPFICLLFATLTGLWRCCRLAGR